MSVTKKTVKLTCNASGLPEPAFSWITPDGTLVNSTVSAPNLEHLEDNSRVIRWKMLQNDGSLLIFYTRVADQGIYKCIATNILGHDVGKVNLTVREGEISFRLEPLGKEGSPHVRESQTIWYWIPVDCLSVVLGFRIPIVSGIPDSLSCIPDSTSKFSQIPEFGFPY